MEISLWFSIDAQLLHPGYSETEWEDKVHLIYICLRIRKIYFECFFLFEWKFNFFRSSANQFIKSISSLRNQAGYTVYTSPIQIQQKEQLTYSVNIPNLYFMSSIFLLSFNRTSDVYMTAQCLHKYSTQLKPETKWRSTIWLFRLVSLILNCIPSSPQFTFAIVNFIWGKHFKDKRAAIAPRAIWQKYQCAVNKNAVGSKGFVLCTGWEEKTMLASCFNKDRPPGK